MTKKKRERVNVHQVYVDDATWRESKPFLDAVGLSRSKFFELILKALIDSAGKPFAEVQGDLFESMMQRAAAKGLTKPRA